MSRWSLIIVFICIVFSGFSQLNYENALDQLIKVDSINNEFTFLHFTIKQIPEFSTVDNKLTDIYYSIKYREFGTSESHDWVKVFSGHLVNDYNKDYNYQLKGPFWGNRDLSYKFLLEIAKDTSLRISIFSTNPELDAKYCGADFNNPFDMVVDYYDATGIERLMKPVNTLSNISTAYTIINGAVKGVKYGVRAANIPFAVASIAIENIAIYLIETSIQNLPVKVDAHCNVCGANSTHHFKNKDGKMMVKCNSFGCHNMAELRIIYTE